MCGEGGGWGGGGHYVPECNNKLPCMVFKELSTRFHELTDLEEHGRKLPKTV